MRCSEWQSIVERYRIAVREYNNAVENLGGQAFEETWQRAEVARKDVDLARAELLQHEHDHGCVAGPKAQAAKPPEPDGVERQQEVREILNLFDVSSERWEPTEVLLYGRPPQGALAYLQHNGQWIVDPGDLTNRRHDVSAMRYTEAGLAILREEGLEM